MTSRIRFVLMSAAVACTFSTAVGTAAAQEFAIKGGVAISEFGPETPATFGQSVTSTSFGGHYRRNFGAFALQPEVHMVSRGAESDDGTERLKLEYIEVPVLLVLPVKVGPVEVFAFGGPYLGLESRCRYTLEENGLKTSAGCEFLPTPFDRRTLDWGATAGAGAGHPLAGGQVFIEARQTWGMRDIQDGEPDLDVRNRSIVLSLGYTLNLDLVNERRSP